MPALPAPAEPSGSGSSGPAASSESSGAPAPLDLRALLLGVSAWAGGLVGFGLPGPVALGLLGAGLAAVLVAVRRGRPVVTGLACLLVACTVGVAAGSRVEATRSSPVAALARVGAAVTLTGRVTTDPALRQGRFGDYTLTRLTVVEVTGRGRHYRSRVPLLVIGDVSWQGVPLGATVAATGRLAAADGADLAGVLSSRRAPTVLAQPAEVLDVAAAVRSGIREAVSGAPRDARALVPALVDGDDQQLSADLVADFRTCGLTHLAAVSGTNLTLVVGFLLLLARWAGVRAQGLRVVGLLGVLGFVVLARPEPSVLRAAVMGGVALAGMGSGGRATGVRVLGVAVFALLVLDPWLVVSVGFALSSLATAGILLLGPPFRDALQRWLPLWLAEALAVPFAAQLACTPLVAAVSGQVSLVAVVANLAVAPAVAPATVLGLTGGVVVLVVPALGHACGWVAALSGSWIILVATRLAALPTAAVDWSVGPVSLGILVLLCCGIGAAAAGVLRHPRWALLASGLLVAVMLRPLPSPGWPPRGWVMVACDVGQGDGLVLNAGDGDAVVVDTGPDPTAMGRCLGRLGVHDLPVVVLTHFHADHIDGLPTVLDGHRVGEVDVTATDEPASGAREVRRWAAAGHVPVRVPAHDEVRRVGDLTWQVIGPVGSPVDDGAGEEGSVANNASLVLLVEVRGIRILLGGDMEPEAQQALARADPGLRVDVLKVPHHGSRYQDPSLLASLGARLAVVSVGADNDYGHPAAATLALLRRAGMTVERTDQDGDVAVVMRDGRLAVRARGGR